MTASLENNGEGTKAPVVSQATMESNEWNKLPADTKIGNVSVENIKKTKGSTMTCEVDANGKVTFKASAAPATEKKD